MVQTYTLEPTNIDKTALISDQPLGDVYDLFDLVSKIHSEKAELSRDYTLARLDADIIHAQLPKFMRERMKTIRIIRSYLLPPLPTLEAKYGPEQAQRIYNRLSIITDDVVDLLKGELNDMAILSRSVNGQIVDAILAR